MSLKLSKDYQPKMSVFETQRAINEVKNCFDRLLAQKLSLIKVPAPLFVQGDSGLNDNLSGVETPVTFSTDKLSNLQIVHSLAKWKRKALQKYSFRTETGLYTDMNAIRKHEDLSNIHSFYVDQWDWEKIIDHKDRTDEKLEQIVSVIFEAFKETETYINSLYPQLSKKLPDKIHFITSQELHDLYPDYTDKQKENAIVKKYGAVFIKQIGKKLSNGLPHDMRAPDYDDWLLNGDILFYNPVLDCAIELSSMGIRVDKKRLIKQLEESNAMERLKLPYHQAVYKEELPQTVGGGIGQSRTCMFFLEKMHIGEVQSSIWNQEIVEKCADHNIILL